MVRLQRRDAAAAAQVALVRDLRQRVLRFTTGTGKGSSDGLACSRHGATGAQSSADGADVQIARSLPVKLRQTGAPFGLGLDALSI